MKAYIFDFDGTLVDSMDPAIEALLGFLRENGVKYPDDIVATMLPLGYKGIAEYFYKTFGVGDSSLDVFQSLLERLVQVYSNSVEANDGVAVLLKRLKEEGDALYLLTGSPKEFFEPCLKRLGLYDLFAGCWSVGEFAMTKSNPNLYLAVAKKIDVSIEECVVVDDSAEALQTAHSIGMKTVGVYDKYSAKDEAKMRSFADKYIVSFEEF